jgi:hypothetical protein
MISNIIEWWTSVSTAQEFEVGFNKRSGGVLWKIIGILKKVYRFLQLIVFWWLYSYLEYNLLYVLLQRGWKMIVYNSTRNLHLCVKKVFLYVKHNYLYHRHHEQGLWLWGTKLPQIQGMYYTNCHRTNHNMEMCISKKRNPL